MLELQQCTEVVVINHGHIMLWDTLDIFHVCRETRKLILYTACLLQTWELEQILWRQELQAPALTCQATCIFLSVARPKGPDRARIHFERHSDMEGENKNNLLVEAKQSIFNSRPWRKIHELLSMATSSFCHVCCLHSLLLPFLLFSLSDPLVPAVLARVLPTPLSMRPGICR